MGYMFWDCSSLVSLDVSNFDTSSVTNMSNMFWGCSSLTLLDVEQFNTSNVIDMGGMFNDCYKLENLNLSNFTFTNNPKVGSMFREIGGHVEPITLIIVNENGYIYFTVTTSNSGINSDYAKFVKPDGTDWD